ncbi:MAG: hypothetical protein LBR64_09225 [Dysgonamonadaceae bacterium]|jgi:hypothetical protein|nr:hypothetical protein [Dysgonamonadaceae bacterium]
MKYKGFREEELKNKVAQDFFGKFDCTQIVGNIDFTVARGDTVLLWAEAKAASSDILAMLSQLVLTVGKARTFDKFLPPPFLCCFDCGKIAFVPYSEIQDVFYQNDFNWKVAPSDRNTREFQQIYRQIRQIVENDLPFETYLFDFEDDESELKQFIRENFRDSGSDKNGISKLQIDKNNFITIFNKWLAAVQPTIAVNWEKAKARGIIGADFYLADLLSLDNKTLKDKLFVLLRGNYYEFDRVIDDDDIYNSKRADFSDGQKAYRRFWTHYERPPQEEYWDYIIERRDLLVPQDVRERKGSFFTPAVWVEKSQEYLAKTLGEDWQDEYYIWDCCAGTGNLLAGLTDKYRIWASTLDKQDVDVMRDRIRNGANLLEEHVFQFDFLNDSFDKLPEGLRNIINNPKLRNRLVIYINPPYAEASKMRTLKSGNEGSRGVEQSAVNKKYANILGQGNAELFAQFFTRIYCELPGVILAEFSTLKHLQGQHFVSFRSFFHAKLKKMFIMPANTFDNVKGSFPIGFLIWDTNIKEQFKRISSDVFDNTGKCIGKKRFSAYTNNQYINDWIKPYRAAKHDKSVIGKFPFKGNDFQNQGMITIVNVERPYNVEAGQFLISPQNLIPASVYFAVRKCVEHTWTNNQDQFLFPNKKWEKDIEFQNDCLAYTIFTNKISSSYGTNHWIPFAEAEINARTRYDSHILITFLSGKIVKNAYTDLFEHIESKKTSKITWKEGVRREFSPEATAVFDAGRELWKYYHAQPKSNVNASLYDIREYFQGRGENGKMNNRSEDEKYNELIDNLRNTLKTLAAKIEPKIYEYGFLI